MRKIFNSVATTPIEAYYLETGTLPIRFYISQRRLMFLWTILEKPDTELVKQVYNAQKMQPVKNDWYLQVQQGLKDFNINLSEEEIKSLKREKFKTIVKKSVKEQGEIYLSKSRSNHSKSKNLNNKFELQDYLVCHQLNIHEKQLLFKFRTQTYECKANYRRLYEPDLSCFVCQNEDTQEHLTVSCKVSENMNMGDVSYEDIFGSVENQIKITKLLKIIDEQRFMSKRLSHSIF